MRTNRRRFLELAAGAGALSFATGAESAAAPRRVTVEALDKAAAAPVLNLRRLNSPVIIESIDLLRKGNDVVSIDPPGQYCPKAFGTNISPIAI